MKNSLNQLCIGLWLAMGVGMGIMNHSWYPVWTLGLVAVFFGIGFWASSERKARREAGIPSPVANTVMYSHFTLIVSFFVFGLMITAERIYVVNGEHYPAILAKRDLGPTTENGLFKLADAACERRHPVEIYQKAGDLAVIRCGTFWYQGGTFTARVVEKESQT